MKFDVSMQIGMPMTMNRSNSKPEVECQYGGRSFSKIGSSNNSAVDWDIASKFVMQIDFDFSNEFRYLNRNRK